MTAPKDFKSAHFLIVDDYKSMRILLKGNLQGMGINKISEASSGNAAYKYLCETIADPTKKIDFVVTDMLMEDGSGIDLVKSIRADQKLKHLPVLMITSMADIENMLNAVKAGVSDYIVKPWEPSELERKLGIIFKKHYTA